MFNRIKFIKIMTMAIGVFIMNPVSSAVADDQACQSCIKEKIDARWALRQQCIAGGGNDTTCNGPEEDKGNPMAATCCQCTKGPAPNEDPDCWTKNCQTECWNKQCESVCPAVLPSNTDQSKCAGKPSFEECSRHCDQFQGGMSDVRCKAQHCWTCPGQGPAPCVKLNTDPAKCAGKGYNAECEAHCANATASGYEVWNYCRIEHCKNCPDSGKDVQSGTVTWPATCSPEAVAKGLANFAVPPSDNP